MSTNQKLYIKKNSYWAIGTASKKEIEKINILNASLLAMKRSILKLKFKPQIVKVDGNKKPNINNLNIKSVVRGDQKIPEISAASILAKVSRDRLIKKMSKKYNYPLFPEDFAYYLLNDNNTLILISAKKNFYENLKYDIKNNKLEIANTSGKLNFIISSYAENCGYKSLKNNFECNIYKPLISKNLLN